MDYSDELTPATVSVGMTAHFFDNALDKWRDVKVIGWFEDAVDTEEIDTGISISGPFNMFFVQ